jgi:hypothetical protein
MTLYGVMASTFKDRVFKQAVHEFLERRAHLQGQIEWENIDITYLPHPPGVRCVGIQCATNSTRRLAIKDSMDIEFDVTVSAFDLELPIRVAEALVAIGDDEDGATGNAPEGVIFTEIFPERLSASGAAVSDQIGVFMSKDIDVEYYKDPVGGSSEIAHIVVSVDVNAEVNSGFAKQEETGFVKQEESSSLSGAATALIALLTILGCCFCIFFVKRFQKRGGEKETAFKLLLEADFFSSKRKIEVVAKDTQSLLDAIAKVLELSHPIKADIFDTDFDEYVQLKDLHQLTKNKGRLKLFAQPPKGVRTTDSRSKQLPGAKATTVAKEEPVKNPTSDMEFMEENPMQLAVSGSDTMAV